jgi:hypothetical protein
MTLSQVEPSATGVKGFRPLIKSIQLDSCFTSLLDRGNLWQARRRAHACVNGNTIAENLKRTAFIVPPRMSEDSDLNDVLETIAIAEAHAGDLRDVALSYLIGDTERSGEQRRCRFIERGREQGNDDLFEVYIQENST